MMCHVTVGKGRGRQVIAVARTADVILTMLDAGKGDIQRRLLEKELESVGIRLNKRPPNIYFKVGRKRWKEGGRKDRGREGGRKGRREEGREGRRKGRKRSRFLHVYIILSAV